MKKILFFDLDGTLLDTLGDLHEAVNAALSHYGLKRINLEQTRAFVGQGTQVLLNKACAGSCPPGLKAYYEQYYNQHLTVHTMPYAGMTELIQELKKHFILIMHTNKYQQAAVNLVDHFFRGAFSQVLGDGVYARKPDPEAVLKTLESYGCTHSQALFIGDSEVDAETARQAGIDCLITAWGYGTSPGNADLETLRQTLLCPTK